ncbi:MAG: 50S ribosomal protein L24 [Patescibacteria group bacterium UBA2103]
MKIKKNDTVKVIAGKDKGKTGKVLTAFPKEDKVLVEGVNVFKKAVKQTKTEKGGFKDVTRPIHVSNVMIVDPKENVPTRIGIIEKDGKRVRVAKKSNTELS